MKKPSIIKSILSFLLKVIVVLVIMCCFGLGSYEGVTYYISGKFVNPKELYAGKDKNTSSDTEATTEVEIDDSSVEDTLLFVDAQDGTSDYIILSMLNVDTNALDLVFLPENTQVTVGKSMQKKLSKKMDGIHESVDFEDIERCFGDDKYEIISEIVSEMLNIKIDGWDHMTYKNAVSFLDTVKYVDMTLDNAISYRDNEGVLHIMNAGDIQMSGEEAYDYMTYMDGTSEQESDRLERVNTYLESFLSRMLDKKEPAKIVENYQKYTESSSNRSLDALTAALKAAKNSDFITLRILQGSEDGDTFTIDSQKAQLQVNTLAQQAASYSADDKLGNDSSDDSTDTDFDEESSDSKDLSIEIYNAAYVQGIASEWEYYLEDQGYNITLVDTYQQEGPISTTRIVVDKDGIGEDLLKYFPDAEISVGEIDTGGDIQIYVGTDSTDVGASEE